MDLETYDSQAADHARSSREPFELPTCWADYCALLQSSLDFRALAVTDYQRSLSHLPPDQQSRAALREFLGYPVFHINPFDSKPEIEQVIKQWTDWVETKSIATVLAPHFSQLPGDAAASARADDNQAESTDQRAILSTDKQPSGKDAVRWDGNMRQAAADLAADPELRLVVARSDEPLHTLFDVQNVPLAGLSKAIMLQFLGAPRSNMSDSAYQSWLSQQSILMMAATGVPYLPDGPLSINCELSPTSYPVNAEVQAEPAAPSLDLPTSWEAFCSQLRSSADFRKLVITNWQQAVSKMTTANQRGLREFLGYPVFDPNAIPSPAQQWADWVETKTIATFLAPHIKDISSGQPASNDDQAAAPSIPEAIGAADQDSDNLQMDSIGEKAWSNILTGTATLLVDSAQLATTIAAASEPIKTLFGALASISAPNDLILYKEYLRAFMGVPTETMLDTEYRRWLMQQSVVTLLTTGVPQLPDAPLSIPPCALPPRPDDASDDQPGRSRS